MPSFNTYVTLQLISAPISLACSCLILYVIFRSREKISTTLNRLLVGLCVGDILSSLALLCGKLTYQLENGLPVATSKVGCEIQGYFMIIGTTLSPFYNCSLCFFYLAVIRYGVTEEVITRRLEPLLHFVPIAWSLFGANYALSKQAINPYIGDCWIHPAPFNCVENENIDCERGENANQIRWIVSGVPTFIILFTIIILMTIMFVHVRGQELRTIAMGFRNTILARAHRNETSMSSNITAIPGPTGILRQSVSNSRRVLNQAIAYVSAYLLSYTFIYCNAIYFIRTKGSYNNTITSLLSFFFPLQGFFNLVVFIFPRLTRQLRAHENYNFFQGLYAAIQCKKITRPTRNRASRSRHTNRTSSFVPGAHATRQSTIPDVPTVTTPVTAVSNEPHESNNEDLAVISTIDSTMDKRINRASFGRTASEPNRRLGAEEIAEPVPRRVRSVTFDPSLHPTNISINQTGVDSSLNSSRSLFNSRLGRPNIYSLSSIGEASRETDESDNGSNSEYRTSLSSLRTSTSSVRSSACSSVGSDVRPPPEEEQEDFP